MGTFIKRKIGRTWAVLGFLVFLIGIPGVWAEVSEYTVKAAFIYNFAKFVTWPAKSLGKAGSPMVIGVLGDDPFGSALDDAVAGKSVDGHPLTVKRFDGFSDANAGALRKCQILFISYSEKDKVGDVLTALKGASVLTVSEIEKFPLKGGDVLFDMEGSKVTLEINPEAAKKAGLEISSKLLQVAKIYKSE
jgi:hypothetical protein